VIGRVNIDAIYNNEIVYILPSEVFERSGLIYKFVDGCMLAVEGLDE
jgi:hypothetical protein